MCDVNSLFYRPEGNEDPIEGYLSDEAKADCKILFVLREPHDDNPREFWFRESVVNIKDGKRKGTKYFNSLGSVAYRLLGGKKDPEEKDLEKALKQCAYINIHPECGKERTGEVFDLIVREIAIKSGNKKRRGKEPDDSIKDRAKNRIELLGAINCSHIVTTVEIFNALVGVKKKTGEPHSIGITHGQKEFRIASYRHKTIMSFFAYSGWKYELDDFKKVEEYCHEM